ncbi:MAG TPA: cytochrome c [Hyphomicrobiaceae bacterium]|nr:cytochrome c [Hyphomicrobiaceae bacterium]
MTSTADSRGATRRLLARTLGGAALAVLVMTGATPVVAQQSAMEKMAARGSELAVKLCASCHLTPDSNASGQPAAPSLRTIANVPEQTGTRIRNVLVNPAHDMPDISLTNDEIVALIAYIDTLRADRTKPLLTGPDNDGKRPPPSKS